MEESLPLHENTTAFCNSCNTAVSNADAFCNNCGYPLHGTEQEQMDFISNRTYKEIDLEDYNKQIKKAGMALYLIAAFALLWGIILYATSKELAILLGSLIICIIFVALGAWSRRKPLAAILSGAALYAILIILSAIDNPITIVSGIIWKVLIIGAFIRGIKSAIEAEKIKKELNLN